MNDKIVEKLIIDFALMRKSMLFFNNDTKINFTNSQKDLIYFVLSAKTPPTVGELAKNLQITSSAVTQQIEGLEKLNIIQRLHSNNSDKRSVSISLTKLGHKKIKTLKEFYRNHLSQVFKVLSQDEINMFCSLMNKVASNCAVISKKEK